MATATIVFSAPAPVVSGHNEFITSFTPPSNVSGRSCYLKVTNVAAMRAANSHLTPYTIYMVTMDFSQPFSYGSINDPVGQTIANTGQLIERQSKNRVVAMFKTGKEQTAYTSVFPRILVDIPDGPQYVTVGLWRTDGPVQNNKDQLSVIFELTPIDSDEERHLAI